MKKSLLILTALLVVVMGVVFVGCSSIPAQTMLSPKMDPNSLETFTYDVKYDKEGAESIGTLSVYNYNYSNKETLNLNELIAPIIEEEKRPSLITLHDNISNFSGMVSIVSLKINDGQYKYSIVVTNPKIITSYSFAKSSLHDEKSDKIVNIEQAYTYNKKDVSYTIKGDIEKEGTIKMKEYRSFAYFDNAFYLTLCSTFENGIGQLAFATPSYEYDKMERRVATRTNNKSEVDTLLPLANFIVPVKEPEEGKEPEEVKPLEKVPCTIFTIASTEKMPGPGKPNVYHYSTLDYKFNDGSKDVIMKNLLVQFEEHGVIYRLKSITKTNF